MCIFPDEEKKRRPANERIYSKKSLNDFSQLVIVEAQNNTQQTQCLNVFMCHFEYWFCFFCTICKCQTTGTVSVLAEPSPSERCPHVTTPGGGGSWHHISAALAVSAWTLPYGKGRHSQACTLKYPVTMGREEWEREWKSAPSVLAITPTAWWTSWESILSAYSAAAAVGRQSCV